MSRHVSQGSGADVESKRENIKTQRIQGSDVGRKLYQSRKENHLLDAFSIQSRVFILMTYFPACQSLEERPQVCFLCASATRYRTGYKQSVSLSVKEDSDDREKLSSDKEKAGHADI